MNPEQYRQALARKLQNVRAPESYAHASTVAFAGPPARESWRYPNICGLHCAQMQAARMREMGVGKSGPESGANYMEWVEGQNRPSGGLSDW